MDGHDRCGLVLSGGGARGAYEAGVLAGVVEVLGLRPQDRSPFDVFAGTSVGAINAAYMAAYSHRGDHNVTELMGLWRSLRLGTHLKVDPLGLVAWPRAPRGWPAQLPWPGRREEGSPPRTGRSLLDPRPLERLVRDTIPWSALHENIREGRAKGLIVAALHIATGRTTIFAEMAPGVTLRPTKNPRRIASFKPLSADHILASAALPALFPARRLGDTYYCDGGLRFNTPIAPAIRAGATRLLVVSLMHQDTDISPSPLIARLANTRHMEQYPDMAFLFGKLLNAILLDPIMYDLQMLDRVNALVDAVSTGLPPEARAQVDAVMKDKRGMPYRRLETLVFTPSQDIGQMAAAFLQELVRQRASKNRLLAKLLSRASSGELSWEADLASYLLFDGDFATRLIEMGRRDAHRRAAEVRAFFGARGAA